MRRNMFARAVLTTATFMMLGAHAEATEFSARFSGFLEVGGVGVGQTGAILSNGQGRLTLKLNKQLQSIAFTLTYSDLGSPVTQAHIHFGKRHVGGGIIAFLCSNLGNGPPGTQPCPANGGTVSGTLTPASVVGPTAQNIAAGNFDGLTEALQSHTAYGNIHTQQFGAGEIRGEIRRDDRDDRDDDRR
jgi:CHRD domain